MAQIECFGTIAFEVLWRKDRVAPKYTKDADMTVAPDVFVVLRDYMDCHLDVGIVAPKILNPDGTIKGLIK